MVAPVTQNLVATFFERAEAKGDAPFLWAKRDGAYEAWSWRRVAETVSALSRGLGDLGVEAGDRVVLVSENRPEWVIADLAIMAAGAVTVPAYTTNSADDHAHILGHSGAAALIVSTAALARPLLAAAKSAPEVKLIIAMEAIGGGEAGSMVIHSWDDVIARGGALTDDVAARVATIAPADLACFIYTSGTGGRPKGVMLSHGAIAFNVFSATDLLTEVGLGDDVFLSFLPLSHSYEHTCGLHLPISMGAQIYYAEGIETLSANMAEARPTIMTCVPRLYEIMRTRILAGVTRAGGLKKTLFEAALRLGRKRHEGGELSLLERLLDRLVERLVRDKVRLRFGGRMKALVSGGAPLNYDVGMFFLALGLPVYQGYGQTEAAPLISCNRKSNNNIASVGPALAGVEARIAEDGEICVRGGMLMEGYWNDAEATGEALRDGWLHTGDIGHIDEAGCIHITDRKKDIIVNSGGDNIAPARVEGVLTLEPEIAQALVYGDRRAHLVALIVPAEDFIESHAKGLSLADLAGDADFHGALGEAVRRASDSLSSIEKVKRFAIAKEPFTIDNGEMTPTLKTRRHAIISRYRDTLDGLY
ncbi:MAG: long-chain fatty acid--CoA ligase [Proteobacteria bacterium]|nr:long-chain fatty acid--CoA ligase [Pseudomonadota bacterium]